MSFSVQTQNALEVFAIAVGLILFVYGGIYWGNLAWRHPNQLKSRLVSYAEHLPKWFPFRRYFIVYYDSDKYVWTVRISTTIGLLIPLALLVITVLGLLGLLK